MPVASDWGDVFGDSVIAAAILDRLMHNAVVFNIRGPSWRPREHNSLETATTEPAQSRICCPPPHQPEPLAATRLPR